MFGGQSVGHLFPFLSPLSSPSRLPSIAIRLTLHSISRYPEGPGSVAMAAAERRKEKERENLLVFPLQQFSHLTIWGEKLK